MHDARTTARTIATELGEAGERWLASVEPTPVGSGCIAQVHRAVGADGARLAVKVLHPGVEAVVGADLCLLRAAAWAVEALVPLPGLRWLALREAVDEFARFMAMQAPRYLPISPYISLYLHHLATTSTSPPPRHHLHTTTAAARPAHGGGAPARLPAQLRAGARQRARTLPAAARRARPRLAPRPRRELGGGSATYPPYPELAGGLATYPPPLTWRRVSYPPEPSPTPPPLNSLSLAQALTQALPRPAPDAATQHGRAAARRRRRRCSW